MGDNNKIISDKNKNKFFEEKYLIKSPYYTFNDKRIAVFSDIHYQAHVSKDIYLLIYYYVLKCRPDYVVFPGDIFENDSIIDNKEELDFFSGLGGQVLPNIVTDIYKVRSGEWNQVRIWSYIDLGTLRKEDLYLTDARMEIINLDKHFVYEIDWEGTDYVEVLKKVNEIQ